jgi:hypothetical protein
VLLESVACMIVCHSDGVKSFLLISLKGKGIIKVLWHVLVLTSKLLVSMLATNYKLMAG